MKKDIVLIAFIAFFAITSHSIPAASAAPSNPIFATIEYVQSLFQQNQTDLEFLQERVRKLEDELESSSLPEGKWVHACFDVATKNLFVMKDGSCIPHVHWKIFVQCYPGTPCAPDNPADSYFDFPQEQ